MYTENKEGKEPQISFSASKKVAPTAVARNNLRRRGYSAVTPLVCHITPKAMILVSYLVADTQVTLPEIREELKKAFIQAGLYKKDE
jgi:ribonuclease P protein component